MSATALLVQLKIKTWTARKFDRTATAAVDQQYHASNAGRYNKLLIDPAHLKPLSTAVSRIREFHYRNTLAADNGLAVLPSSNYFNYMTGIGQHIDEFKKVANEFIDKFPEYKLEAEKRLNGLYNPEDYPVAFDFDAKVNILPIPENDAWKQKLDIQDDSLTEMLAQAETELIERLKSAVSQCVNRLKAPEMIFRQALIDSCHSIADLAPSLNFSGNKNINDWATELKDTLAYYTAEDVRKDEFLRKQLTEELSSLLEKIQ